MADYRWNELDNARGYDQAAEHVHPYYREVQDVILDHLPLDDDSADWVVDLGGGSGWLAERILDRWHNVRICVVDQSEAFLTLAGQRLERFGDHATCLCERLQNDWSSQLPEPPRVVLSMSAIHHLDGAEKAACYRQAAVCLAAGGVLMNGDEVRPPDDADYLAECRRWAEHMRRVMAAGQIPELFHEALHGWIDRNVERSAEPRASGDDCHETAEVQLGYFAAAGLNEARVVWHRDLWMVLFGQKQKR